MDLPGTTADVEGRRLLGICMQACVDCHRSLRGFALDAGSAGPGDAAQRALRRLMLDCAEVCEATASYARCGSVFLSEVVLACTRMCDECAAACELRPPATAVEACAEACRQCARACFAVTCWLRQHAAGRKLPSAAPT